MLVTPEMNRNNCCNALTVSAVIAVVSGSLGWLYPPLLALLVFVPVVYWLLRRRCLRRMAVARQPFPAEWQAVLEHRVRFYRPRWMTPKRTVPADGQGVPRRGPSDRSGGRRWTIRSGYWSPPGRSSPCSDLKTGITTASGGGTRLSWGFRQGISDGPRRRREYLGIDGAGSFTRGCDPVEAIPARGLLRYPRPRRTLAFTSSPISLSKKRQTVVSCRTSRPRSCGSGLVTSAANSHTRRTSVPQSTTMPTRTSTSSSRVLSEYFFGSPEVLRAKAPALYDLLRKLFHQDPAATTLKPVSWASEAETTHVLVGAGNHSRPAALHSTAKI